MTKCGLEDVKLKLDFFLGTMQIMSRSCPPLLAAHQLLLAPTPKESASLSLGLSLSLSLSLGWEHEGLQCRLIVHTPKLLLHACSLMYSCKLKKMVLEYSVSKFVHLVSQFLGHERLPDCARSPRVCSD